MLRTYHIFTYGFTAIEENIIGKMLPDQKSVLVSTDCFTAGNVASAPGRGTDPYWKNTSFGFGRYRIM